MSEYDRIDFEMLEENDDDYDGPDAYVDEEDDSVLDLEDLQDMIQERTGVARESPMLPQIFLCEFTRCRTCPAHPPLTCSVIQLTKCTPD